MNMRAVVISEPGGPEALELRDVPVPEPAADQVRVRVHAAGLNRADLLQRAGRYPAPADAPAEIPGLEIAGEVDACGPAVTTLHVGDRVFGIVGGGGHAEYAITAADLLAPIPDNLDWTAAAAVPEVFMTADDALFSQAKLTIGERVLIHAAGSGVGTAAIQLARAAGATVYGTARSDSKLQQAAELGLQHALAPEAFNTQILALTNGAGVDVLVDFVGAPYLAANLDALAPQGRMVLVGTLGGAEAPIDLGLVMRKRLKIYGTVLRSRPRREKAEVTARFTARVLPLLASEQLRPIVDRVFRLDEIGEAHRYMESNANFGKIVLRMDHA